MYDNEYYIGDPGEQFNYWIHQDAPDNCAVAAETSIINQFGDHMSLDDASYISASNGWYHPGSGTQFDEIGNLMDLDGIPNHTVMGGTVQQLAAELQQGHGIIVGVNSAEIWDEGIWNDIEQFFLDAFGLGNISPADHAVVVTGLDVSNPNHPMVIINDSGVPNGAAVRYPLAQFKDAWENSGFFYTATDVPIPNHPSPNDFGFDVGNFLGLATTIVTGSPESGMLVNMLTNADWEAILAAV